ncbi:MAG: GNAT family N-acetyltransferase [Acutalibacteraceae bacterium]
MTLYENKLTAEDFCDLQEAVGFGRPNLSQIKTALKNSIYIVSAEIDGEVVGMGRLVGDYARIFYIQDVFISPNYQRQGIGTAIMKKLLSYIKDLNLVDCNIMVGLMSAKGKEDFYKRFGFKVRPNDFQGCGMMMNIEKHN